MDRQTQAYLYAAATIFFWSTVASAFKLSLRYLSFAELLFYSSLVSLCVLTVIMLIGGQLGRFADWGRRDYAHSALMGFLNPFFYYLLLFKAYSLLPAQEAQPLNFTWPIVLVLLSIVFLGQKVHLSSLFAMAVSFSGVLAISTRGDVLGFQITDGLGVTLALASTVVWASYWILGVRDGREPVARLFMNFVFGFGFMALYMLILGEWRTPALAGLMGAVYIGLFEMGITFVLWLKALKLSRTTAQVSNLIYLTPFLSLIVIHFAVGEPIYPSTIAGLALIVGGILLQQYGRRLFGKTEPFRP